MSRKVKIEVSAKIWDVTPLLGWEEEEERHRCQERTSKAIFVSALLPIGPNSWHCGVFPVSASDFLRPDSQLIFLSTYFSGPSLEIDESGRTRF